MGGESVNGTVFGVCACVRNSHSCAMIEAMRNSRNLLSLVTKS